MEPDRIRAIADIEQAQKELVVVGHPELNETEEQYFILLGDAKRKLKAGANLPPLRMLDLFIYSKGTGHTVPGFIVDWLYNGAIQFQNHRGKWPFERGLGFTCNPDGGKHSGQGHEFEIEIRNQILNREKIYHWIWCLNKIERYKVEESVEIIQQLVGKIAEENEIKGLSYLTLEREYKAWRGKKMDYDDEIREGWTTSRSQWFELFRSMNIILPQPKQPTRK